MSEENPLKMVDNTEGEVINPYVLKSELAVPVLTLSPQPINLTFSDDDGRVIGEFTYNREEKRWSFQGDDMDESAKIFAKFMYAHFQSLIEGRDGL